MTEQTPTSEILNMARAICDNPTRYELVRFDMPKCAQCAFGWSTSALFKTPNGELLCPTHAAVRAIDKGMED